MDGDELLKVTFANQRVEKFFADYNRMKRKLPEDWVRKIKMHLDRLKAAECFGDFLKLGLGKPEKLSGNESIRYSLHIAPHIRLILRPNTTWDRIMDCREIEVEGVCDYHGDKENRYTP